MKIALTSIAAAMVVATTSAFAADLPSRAAPPVFVPPPPIPTFTWTGFYLGANAGFAFDARSNFTVNNNGFQTPFFNNLRSDGFTGGGQIGYNYELGNALGFGGLGGGAGGGVVIGIEADASFTDLHHTTFGPAGAFNVGPGVAAPNSTFASRTDFVGTVRGRLGYAFDRVFIYGTGGFAYGGVRNFASFNNGFGNSSGASDTLLTGVAYGGGIEYALPTASFLNFFNSSAVTVKAEFIHYDLGTRNFDLPGFDANNFRLAVHTQGDIARAGLNFKFGSPLPAPVVARY